MLNVNILNKPDYFGKGPLRKPSFVKCSQISFLMMMMIMMIVMVMVIMMVMVMADLPTPITCKSGGLEKQAQKNLEIRTSNLETSKICVK